MEQKRKLGLKHKIGNIVWIEGRFLNILVGNVVISVDKDLVKDVVCKEGE